MKSIKNNPSFRFFNFYQSQIQEVRNSLFSQLEEISPDFSSEIINLFEDKLRNNDNKPPLGELFPWIIKDLTSMRTATVKKISIGWFAIYLYTLFLDEYVDDKKPIKPEVFLAGSILAKIGLTNLTKIVKGTKYESLVDKSLNESALYQLRDVRKQNTKGQLNEKEIYSAGKNKIIFACAGALAASNSKHSKFIIQLTNSLLLSLQYLDDIADFEEDFLNSNYTVLLHNIDDVKVKSLFSKTNNTSYRILLSQLIVNGSLERVTTKLSDLFSNSIHLIKQLDKKVISKTESYILFKDLIFLIDSLNQLLKSKAVYFPSMSKFAQEDLLNQVEQKIKYIAQSS